MPPKPRFCAQCGAALTTRVVDDRDRDVCPDCGTVFYRNPLPIASAVVLNDRREVLLVKRGNEPQKGMWCLPIGFAELGETIAEAALRELSEEAGIEGRILRHLDVDSYQSSYYGDLLIVTFEVEPIGGEPRAGDDAEEAGWFALDDLPRLAFSSNVKAVEACREHHREEWAIQDSFARLQGSATSEMLSDPLVSWIRDQASEIAGNWLIDVRSNPTTRSYHEAAPEPLRARATSALQHFGRWLRGEEAPEEVRTYYRNLGKMRRREGVPLHELLSSLTLFRKHIYDLARNQGIWQRTIDVYKMM